MLVLEPNRYAAAKTPLEEVPFNTLFARSVVDGSMPGVIYVDDLQDPGAFYVQHPYGMSLLFGTTDDEPFHARLRAHLLNSEGTRNRDEWLQVAPASWSRTLEAMMGPRLARSGDLGETHGKVVENTRVNFAFDRDRYDRQRSEAEDPGHEVVRVTEAIFRAMPGTVVPRNFWPSSERFLSEGAGTCIVIAGEVACLAFSSFVIGNQFELGIETLEAYRGKGLARIVCSALIDYCLERGYEPVWACRLENSASHRLAERLGFVPTLRLPYYRLVV